MKDRHPSSYRDPAARIVSTDQKVVRALTSEGVIRFEAYRSSGFQALAEASGWVARSWPTQLPLGIDSRYVDAIEHEKIRFVSYPYEWPFALLKRAALFHLELNLSALDHGLKMVDASAFNVQFRGVTPVFIDVPSFAPNVEGEPWLAHAQFCEQFLNPLLLASSSALSFQALFRGSLSGISTDAVSSVLSSTSWLSPDLLLHVHLPARAARSARSSSAASLERVRRRRVPKSAVQWMMKRLWRLISRLTARHEKNSVWAGYRADRDDFARDDEVRRNLVKCFVCEHRIRSMLDVGCNDGTYSEVAVEAGVEHVVAIDSDLGALQRCHDRAAAKRLPVVPILQDWCNTSPEQGWLGMERTGFANRLDVDGLVAFAVLHHLCLGRNLPIDEAVASLVRVAARGLIEFVPKEDERATLVLALKAAEVHGYDRGSFLAAVSKCARIVRVIDLPDTQRCVVEYVRN